MMSVEGEIASRGMESVVTIDGCWCKAQGRRRRRVHNDGRKRGVMTEEGRLREENVAGFSRTTRHGRWRCAADGQRALPSSPGTKL